LKGEAVKCRCRPLAGLGRRYLPFAATARIA
jgi:hypothetical protein